MAGDDSPHKRRERYLRHAREAKELAERTRDPGIAETFQIIARAWEKLAREIHDG